jgi:DNA repair exonuclease SbcCD ATPase subunit
MNDIQTQRTPDVIGAEIRGLTQQAKTMTVWFGIEIGRRLTEAKEMLEHGQWLAYLKEQTEFSRSSAGRLMTLYKKYGAAQTSLFGAEANYPTLNNLSISNALRLLAVPEDEREEFAAEHDVEHMSARELDELIKQRDEAEQRAARAEEQVQQAADGAAKADEQYQKAKQELHLLREKLGNAAAQKAAAEKELFELRERPVEVAVEVDEKAVEEAVTAARAKNDAEWAEKMAKVKNELSEAGLKAEKLKAKIKKAEERAEEKAAELERLKKSQTLNDPNTAVFKQIFEQVQEDFNKLHGSLLKVRASDPDTAEKLTAAVRALVDKMQGALNG